MIPPGLFPFQFQFSLSSAMDNNNQRNISEQLQVLREMLYQGASTRSNKRSRDTNRDLRLLDTIAVALTTGNPGDVFAASFNKRKQMQLVLVKNGPPIPEDVAAATELTSLIGSPMVSDAMDLFPFLMRRCGANINKRIHNLHMQSSATTSRWHWRHMNRGLILQPSFHLQTHFLGNTGMQCLRLRPCGENLLKI